VLTIHHQHSGPKPQISIINCAIAAADEFQRTARHFFLEMPKVWSERLVALVAPRWSFFQVLVSQFTDEAGEREKERAMDQHSIPKQATSFFFFCSKQQVSQKAPTSSLCVQSVVRKKKQAAAKQEDHSRVQHAIHHHHHCRVFV